MADMTQLKGRIRETIYPNGTGAITAESHQALLLEMVDDINATKADKEALEDLKEKVENLPQGDSYDDTELKEQIAELQSNKIDKHNDDYYPTMAVGLADNLSGVDVVDSEVNFRRSGGGAISDGVARIEAIKGNSVVWNQLFTFPYATMTSSGVTVSKNADNSLTCVGTLTDTYFNFGQFQSNIENHKYLFILDASAALDGYNFGLLNRNAQMKISGGFAYVFHTNSDISKGKYIGIRGFSVGNEVNENLFVLQIDLTKAFPNDWQNINTIEDFYARIPMGVDLNAYNEGEVIHMDVQSIESQGVNAWDEEWEVGQYNTTTGEKKEHSATIRNANYIPILPNTQYYWHIPTLSKDNYAGFVLFYDRDKNYLYQQGMGGTAFGKVQTPSNAAYMNFYLRGEYGTTYNHDICINISDTSINGKYFPYIKRVEDLAVIRKYFPQGMKSAGTAHDEIRYNKESGKWEKVEATGVRAYQEGDADNAAYLTDGKVTCYPLAEPIVTELDAEDQFRDLDYQVWNAGTEKAIAEGKSAPLAADITYGFNAIGKIKELEQLVKTLTTQVASLTNK